MPARFDAHGRPLPATHDRRDRGHPGPITEPHQMVERVVKDFGEVIGGKKKWRDMLGNVVEGFAGATAASGAGPLVGAAMDAARRELRRDSKERRPIYETSETDSSDTDSDRHVQRGKGKGKGRGTISSRAHSQPTSRANTQPTSRPHSRPHSQPTSRPNSSGLAGPPQKSIRGRDLYTLPGTSQSHGAAPTRNQVKRRRSVEAEDGSSSVGSTDSEDYGYGSHSSSEIGARHRASGKRASRRNNDDADADADDGGAAGNDGKGKKRRWWKGFKKN